MKIIVWCLLLLPLHIFSQPCDCIPETVGNKQHRTQAKHETNYSHYALKRDTISVSYIYGWESQYASKTATIKTNPDNPDSKRKNGTPEDTLYVLKGYLWFVKKEKNDCDFHIEIGPKTKSGIRIVVEVTKDNCALQNEIKAHLNDSGLKLKKHYKTGLACVVTGLGFYDASHKPNTNHGDKHTKKYSWELHPVKEIAFL